MVAHTILLEISCTGSFYMIALAIILKNSFCDVASKFCDINWVNPLLMDRLVSFW